MKRLMVIIGLILVMLLLVPVSCASSPAVTEEEKAIAPAGEKAPPAPEIILEIPARPPIIIVAEEAVMPGQEGALVTTSQVSQPWAERMIIRTGDISLVVENVSIAIDQATRMADDFAGYVVSSMVWKEGERLVGSIAIRVPAEHFDDAMRALREMAVDVNSESTSSKDVTEEYVDLSAKLENLEATEAQLLKIMEKAETVEDILDVQRELSRTRGDIEQTKARMQYLERTSSTSLIQVRLEQSKLDIEFTADKRRGLKEGQKVQFTVRQIAGGFAPYSYEWDFGDGDISTDETPTHAYKADGSYTVSLTVTDDRGNTVTEIRTDYITVTPGWSAGSVTSEAWNGLVTFGHVLGNIFIWIGIFSPVWVIVGGIVYWRYRRRRKRI